DKDPHPHPMDVGRALQMASGSGDLELLRMLLAHGADVNAQGPPEIGPRVKNGPISLGLFTPLNLGTAYGGVDGVKLLVDAGAKLDTPDVRGMTPLMLAIATDRPDPRVVRFLVEKGASLTAKDRGGETALDWARKYNKPAVLEALGLPPAKSPGAVMTPAGRKVPELRAAVNTSLALLQTKGDSFLAGGGCVACHAQNLAALAVSAARTQGFPVDEKIAKDQTDAARLFWVSQEQTLLQRIDPGGAAETLMYSLLQLALEKVPADRTTDSIIHNLASEQRADGTWHHNAIARPPVEDGDFTFTAFGIRLFKTYAPAGRQAEFAQRIDRAARWLSAAKPITTEDLNFQMLGLTWANRDQSTRDVGLRKIRANQRADGGWAQTPELASDAYATGETLYAMHELGLPPTDEAYRRGIDFLLRTQHPDGSWHVVSRVAKFQPYFQSGFPHDHDQWISAAGTAWATAALIYAAPSAKTLASVR
ncbi:MAG: ankyrin repeat domain-containing protein, partial [Bryobacteraceae bacterium]